MLGNFQPGLDSLESSLTCTPSWIKEESVIPPQSKPTFGHLDRSLFFLKKGHTQCQDTYGDSFDHPLAWGLEQSWPLVQLENGHDGIGQNHICHAKWQWSRFQSFLHSSNQSLESRYRRIWHPGVAMTFGCLAMINIKYNKLDLAQDNLTTMYLSYIVNLTASLVMLEFVYKAFVVPLKLFWWKGKFLQIKANWLEPPKCFF